MNKRRRASSVASSAESDPLSLGSDSLPASVGAPSTRKRKKLDASELCQQMYDALRSFKKEDGSTISDTFVRAPKRRSMPEFYEVVSNPIDLLRVQQKIKTDSYTGLDDMQTDIELLINNAKAFYKPDSSEYQDACELLELFHTNKVKILENNGDEVPPAEVKPKASLRSTRPRRSGVDDEDEMDLYEELFAAVMTATDPITNERPLYKEFQLLPSKRLYPEYYQVIDHPVDLKLIATKIQTNAYTSLTEMEKDLLQMVKNACTFNEPGSTIYKDARTLKKMFMARKVELENGRVTKSLARKRGLSYSAVTAALKGEVESDDDDMDEDEIEAEEGPMLQLFDYLYNAASASDPHSGAPLGESLYKLPNKRFNTDYYATVKKPISMAMIRTKLKNGEYSNITEMTADLYLMLDNAKRAFPASHKAHKDAEKMRKLLNDKLVDIENEEDESESESEEEEEEEEEEAPEESPVAPEKVRVKPRGRPKGSLNLSTLVAKGLIKDTPGMLPLKKRLQILHEHLKDIEIDDRKIIDNFIEKPSKKLYPDYYQVIQNPIDMTIIENRIRDEKYNTLSDAVCDYRLMFSNCRQYNEEGSQIYDDAVTLTKAMNEKLKELTKYDRRVITKVTNARARKATQLEARCRQLFDTIRDYKEPKASRHLSLIFNRLPSKSDYPDYYDIIKHPIDIEMISTKLKRYESVDECAADFMLMFENACKYNEPDSQIYKDALLLQQICIQTKQKLKDAENKIPDVQQAVQELLLSLFTALYNYEDDEGRCYTDSLAELPEYEEIDGKKVRGISLDLVKRRLDKGMYKRLDVFQEDIFEVLERARKLSRTDSQVFEDSIEMQTFFIKKRDELCKGGETLTSPALSYAQSQLMNDVDAVRQSKLIAEQETTEQEEESRAAQIEGESMTIDEKVYSPGDFVYFDLPDNNVPGIMYIERLYTDEAGTQMMNGNLFFRPYETYHVQTRRFLVQEVFKSDQHQSVPMSKLTGRCYVMNVKDYFRMQPEGFQDKDVYVCESRYTTRARSFKKMKFWSYDNENIKLVTREVPLEMNRVQSVFKDRVEKHKEELVELDSQENLVERDRPNVEIEVPGAEEGNKYYEQYNTPAAGVIKTGDFVYVATGSNKQSIAQVCSIWETKDGKFFFRGPWLLTALEIPHSLCPTLYRQEAFLSTVQETTPTIAIVGRCTVLEYLEYSTRRTTEVPEADVYICEHVYDEEKKSLASLGQGSRLRRFTHTCAVTPDEVYHFRKAVTPQREMKIENGELVCINDEAADAIDGGLNETLDAASPMPTILSTPVTSTAKKSRVGKGKVTGYIIYSSEHRRGLCDENPGASFGDISRMLGDEWKNMEQHERSYWEEKAAKMNEESKLKWARESANMSTQSQVDQATANPGQGFQQGKPLPDQIFDCCWERCDYQFEDPADLLEHCITDSTGCVQKHLAVKQTGEPEYHCLWRHCSRIKRGAPPFPNSLRLIKHVRDIHIHKHCGKIVRPHERSKNFVHRKTKVEPHTPHKTQPFVQSSIAGTVGPHQGMAPFAGASPHGMSGSILHFAAPAAEPLFVTVPPRPQRVLHSEAYLKYIEGLQKNTTSICPYTKSLQAKADNTPPIGINRLPSHWLGKRGLEKPDEVVNALWDLRDFMMKDVVQMHKTF